LVRRGRSPGLANRYLISCICEVRFSAIYPMK
jgi:hypothetical protein